MVVKGAQPETSSQKAAILSTAADLFSEYGYSGTTLRGIGKAVGVLPGSLYAHIESKEALLLEVVEQGIQQFLEVRNRIGDLSGSPEEKLRAAIKFHVGLVALNPQYTQVVFHQWRFLSGNNRQRVIDMRRSYADVFREIVESGISDGSFNPAMDTGIEILGLLGMLNWMPEWYLPEGKYSPEEMGDKFADMFLQGILARD